MTLFRCEEQGCLDRRRHASSKIQSEFRKSKGYAEMMYHPTRLKAQGYFNELSFGKKRSGKRSSFDPLQQVNSEIKYLR